MLRDRFVAVIDESGSILGHFDTGSKVVHPEHGRIERFVVNSRVSYGEEVPGCDVDAAPRIEVRLRWHEVELVEGPSAYGRVLGSLWYLVAEHVCDDLWTARGFSRFERVS